MSTYKVRNYNLSYEMMLAAVKEYERFITGGGLNNQLFAYSGMDEEVEGLRLSQMTSTENADENVIFKEIATRVLDRTTGVYFTEDFVTGKAVKWDFPLSLEKYIEVYHEDSAANTMANYNDYIGHEYIQNQTFYKDDVDWYGSGDAEKVPASIEEVSLFDPIKLSHILKGISPKRLTLQDDPEDVAAKKKAKSEEKPRKIFAPSATSLDPDHADSKIPLIAYPINENPSDPDKYASPSLAAYVMKHHKLGMPGKKANHLSVFFGGISALEMSRCTPFLNLMVMHDATRNNPTKKKMNQTAFMRFVRTGKGPDGKPAMVLDESIYGQNGPQPDYGGQTKPEYMEYEDMNISTEYSLMDVFQSPQTMANANINSKGSFDWVSKNVGKGKSYNTSPVLDPIQPFLTLNSMTVSITGAGFGIMASKVANLELTLHDRSRMKEIAPLIASDKFGSTKIRIEYGWTHPDAGPLSNNTIGNYIDGLRDVGLYTVHGSNYSFTGGNTVAISLKLSCAGYAESKSCPAACGPVAPLFMFRDFIDRALQDYIAERESEMSAEEKKKKLPEIRNIVKARGRTAKSPDSLIDFENLRKLLGILGDNKSGKADLVKALSEHLGLNTIPDPPEDDVKAAIADDDFINNTKLDAQEWLFSKLYACEPGVTPDPFAHSFITQCKDTEAIAGGEAESKFPYKTDADVSPFPLGTLDNGTMADDGTITTVSLGKLCTLFVGAPLSTCGLYDEVQIMFYPLNHQAAGARKHTTASFPIEYTAFEKKMRETIASRSRLTVQAFFGIVDKLVRDSYGRAVYGLSGMGSKTALDAFNKLEKEEDRIKEAVGYYKEKASDLGKKGKEKEALRAYKEKLNSAVSTERANRLPLIYDNDGVNLTAEADKFVKPNISMFYEVVPVVDPPGTEDQDNSFEFGFKFAHNSDKKDSDGYKRGKTVLRVHIFDEEAVSDPTSMVLGSVIYEGQTGEIIGETAKHATSDLEANAEQKEVAVAKGVNIKKLVSEMSFGDIKQFMKRSYPSITYGASTGTINSISVSGNTSGQLSNVLMVENYMDNAKTATSTPKPPTDFEETILFPSSISVNMMGMPLIFLGENMFIDFNTDTSLDNIYSVKSVGHTIEAGKFQSNIELVASNQGAVKAFRNQITSKLTQIMGLPE